MCNCFCNPLGDLVAVMIVLKENLEKVKKGEKTLSQALKDTADFIHLQSIIIR